MRDWEKRGWLGLSPYPMGLPLFFGLSPQATNRQKKQDHFHLHANHPHSAPKEFSGPEMQSNHQDTQMDTEGLSPGCEACANRSQGKAAGTWWGRQQGPGVGRPDWGQGKAEGSPAGHPCWG